MVLRSDDLSVLSSSQLFSIVIFGCISNEGYVNRPDEEEEFCIFNRSPSACNYGVVMGAMAFLCCAAFLALDVYFPQISSVKDRKKAVLADVGLSGNATCGLTTRGRLLRLYRSQCFCTFVRTF
ncbi:Synaptogyrin-1 [Liparis tanakae]|uniref:Synaptogyrin-1 n=1 Tax=Liparis tanakae TaxID=230148 RepID=A0A4Z2EAP6_9TELE|nr:Synaptogyrin-1 [Liparis tanakae]